jgi:DNA-directed RNA polymerase specialized sigma24 family protein
MELGYSTEGIARRLGKSKGSAAMMVSRALSRLQRHMKARTKRS